MVVEVTLLQAWFNIQSASSTLSKDRLTALVCANMSGTDKLPMFVIGKSQNPRCFKNVKSLPTEYVTNKKMFESLFFQSLISFEFFDLLILILHKLFCMLYYGVLQTFQANQSLKM
jgi:hypothetical protein